MMRLVALMNVRSHVLLDAQLSPYRRSEMRLADGGEQRRWLIPARKGLVAETIHRYNDDDQLLTMKVSPPGPQARSRIAQDMDCSSGEL